MSSSTAYRALVGSTAGQGRKWTAGTHVGQMERAWSIIAHGMSIPYRRHGTLSLKHRIWRTLLLGVVAVGVFHGSAAAGSAAWMTTPTPDTSTSLANSLEAVSCASTSFCVAAGFASTGTYDQTLIEQWNGTAWSIVPSPNTSTSANNELYGVSCTSQSFCMASGYYFTGTVYQTLIEEWNGTAWSIVASPNTSTSQSNELESVSCFSTVFCFTGGYAVGTTNQTLTEEWNGSNWSITASADSSATQGNIINGISCPAVNFCMAAGIYYDSSGASQTLTEAWNGSSWTLIASPNTSTSLDNALYGVSCIGSSFCIAGDYSNTGSVFQTLILQWNGTSWSTASSPNTSATQSNELLGISCTSSSFCIAAGNFTATSDQTLIEEWNGTSWSIVPSPDTSASQSNDLYGVSCVSTAFCVAAGTYNTGTVSQTLAVAPSSFVQATATLQSGTLSFVTAPSNVTFSPVTLSGVDQIASAIENIDIGDNTGSGSGWSVTLSNTTFTGGTNTLANAAFTAGTPSQPVCDAGATCSPAVWSGNVSYPYVLPGVTATKILSSTANTGMGNETVTLNWSETIPSRSYAATYQSTWTLTLVSGP